MKSDSELLRSFQEERSEVAFSELVERHLDWVYSVALRQVGGDVHLAKDVCQEVFASVARKAKLLRDFEALNGWLFKAVRFAASDMVRAERRRKRREEEVVAMDILDTDKSGELGWEDAGPLLDEAIAELGENDRDVLCLRFFEEKRFAQIGVCLGLSENAARMRVNRALEKLSGILEKRGIRSSSAALAGAVGAHGLVSAPSGLARSIVEGVLGGSVASVGILGGAKLLALLAGGVAAVAVGVAVIKSQESGRLEARLERSVAASEEAVRRVAELERLLAAKTQEVDRTAIRLAELEKLREVAERVVEEEPQLDVMARFQRAQGWKKDGKLEEALEEFLWLFDNGVQERSSFVGVRHSAVLRSILEIGDSIPEAKRELEIRRDRIETEILNLPNSSDRNEIDVHAWARINAELGEQERSIAVFDQVENERLKSSLRIFLKKELMEEKRYEDALRPGYAGLAFANFQMSYERLPSGRFSGEKRAAMIERNKAYAIKSAASDMELLAGAGEVDQAIKLAEEVLVHDSSAETIQLIRTHLEKADRGDLFQALGE
ncbi:RNA polymerase sigma factor [Pelagicoccus mobilis]|uniref:Sigma-70 family RNA polymerase sigma factor n=1 Tax=Pelagicoccus mobilis TaxID=415221 RepID=A0A934VQN4_9BACT|nr:sigma-70 family RNA polymerase sigma factor [Pelagicoccus mobilis]MBK1876758.1 sigma-70 family RNA polymerase sigma factor [Pelagicoccus mobilis]